MPDLDIDFMPECIICEDDAEQHCPHCHAPLCTSLACAAIHRAQKHDSLYRQPYLGHRVREY